MRSRGRRGSSRGPEPRVRELRDGRHDLFLLAGRQLAVDGNRERLLCRSLSVRKISAAMAEVGKAGLQMERHRIVDLVADAPLVEMALQRVAPRCADHELVEDVTAIRRL